MITVRVPKRNKEYFNLYVNGKVIDQEFLKEKGSSFLFEGVCILQYKYRKHRRLYIVRNGSEVEHFTNFYLPNVKEKVGIIYYINRGRKIDLLRQAIFNLEEIGGKEIYLLPTIFWQKFSCLLDTFDGYKSKATKLNLILLYRQYARIKK